MDILTHARKKERQEETAACRSPGSSQEGFHSRYLRFFIYSFFFSIDLVGAEIKTNSRTEPDQKACAETSTMNERASFALAPSIFFLFFFSRNKGCRNSMVRVNARLQRKVAPVPCRFEIRSFYKRIGGTPFFLGLVTLIALPATSKVRTQKKIVERKKNR